MTRREPLASLALCSPLFDELTGQTVCARLAVEAEAAGCRESFV